MYLHLCFLSEMRLLSLPYVSRVISVHPDPVSHVGVQRLVVAPAKTGLLYLLVCNARARGVLYPSDCWWEFLVTVADGIGCDRVIE